ncbi:MAG: hypothetical protein A2751_05770 [Candidatus Doudnabacteria bacterium RIFCSPHIGHO2_01_FULL_46_14]|uniref:Uncharacterized protein n=1 Tax=Candidatus Doudnabacteria bacterium RIFCSPHIGHO2_01_FULL_46_14 TaxID=1817824 RepID=A0A1F5NN64_9BACT|nr:MAG: hypothetical protein A2751_05770 [Candidatus Doudnabacteria bacterium RIFCSPHIGHO2_01_FULL_46_14]
MAGLAQNNFPLQRIDIFVYPSQDDYERARDKARDLLRSIVTELEWSELENKGVIELAGKRARYDISPYSQTEIRDLNSGRITAYACLQLSILAPTYDRMVAEYLLIKNAEDDYWETANIFSRRVDEFGTRTMLLIGLIIAMLADLLLNVFHMR